MTGGGLSRRALARLVPALITAELKRQGLRDETAPADLDSLERLGALAILAETFDVDDPGPAPGPEEGPEAWVDLVSGWHSDRIVLMTSGSTGAPKPCPHRLDDLTGEARFFAGRLPGRRRVVSLVPPHHIYGVIWTLLLPDMLDIPVVNCRADAMPDVRPGDLIVAVPEQWRALSRLVRLWPSGVTGITSAGALEPSIEEAALARGLSRLIEIYGCSEAGGIGFRDAPDMGFTLLPRWQLHPTEDTVQGRDGVSVILPDHAERLHDGRILPGARRDDAVQIGGHNVFPYRVAAHLKAITSVRDAVVRLGGHGRLKAFIVPDASADMDDLRCRIDMLAGGMDPAERPVEITYGEAIPTNPMGKAIDWS